ncbi:MAG: response regulator, partial [Elusimicrobia bacterium]|nr:response regulator [Elusimicrobiota bacterium]
VRGRVLVVDDDDGVRRFAVRCLEREGYEVLSSSDPAEALRLAAANKGLFDLLVIDVVMPQMRGPELAQRLSACQPGARVLYTSGRRREQCGLPKGGKAGFLVKPFTSRDLIEGVSAARRGAGGPSRRARRPGPARSRRKAS